MPLPLLIPVLGGAVVGTGATLALTRSSQSLILLALIVLAFKFGLVGK